MTKKLVISEDLKRECRKSRRNTWDDKHNTALESRVIPTVNFSSVGGVSFYLALR